MDTGTEKILEAMANMKKEMSEEVKSANKNLGNSIEESMAERDKNMLQNVEKLVTGVKDGLKEEIKQSEANIQKEFKKRDEANATKFAELEKKFAQLEVNNSAASSTFASGSVSSVRSTCESNMGQKPTKMSRTNSSPNVSFAFGSGNSGVASESSSAFGNRDLSSVEAGDLLRGMRGATLDGSYKFRTVKIHAVTTNTPQKERLHIAIDTKGAIERLLGHPLNCKAMASNKDKGGRDTSLLFPTRAAAWAVIDELHTGEHKEIVVKERTVYVGMQKVGVELELDKKIGRVLAALRDIAGETKGSNQESKFRANYRNGQICSVSDDAILGYVEADEDNKIVFQTHEERCSAHMIDRSAWNSKVDEYEATMKKPFDKTGFS